MNEILYIEKHLDLKARTDREMPGRDDGFVRKGLRARKVRQNRIIKQGCVKPCRAGTRELEAGYYDWKG